MTETLKSVIEEELQKAYERGVQDGIKQEHAMWVLAEIGQEIEANHCERCGKKLGTEVTDIHTCTPKEQEPIAYLCENAVGHKYFRWKKPSSEYKPIALYTAHASPKQIWQGLTDEEVVGRANAEVFAEAFARGVAWAELKLKEKNSG